MRKKKVTKKPIKRKKMKKIWYISHLVRPRASKIKPYPFGALIQAESIFDASVEYKKKLESRFEISFPFRRVQWLGHVYCKCGKKELAQYLDQIACINCMAKSSRELREQYRKTSPLL